MSRGANATGLATCVKGFLSSQEYQNKALRQFFPKLITTSTILTSESVDFVSLGSHCLVSYSCPFDWIFSCLSMVEHCIKDSFAMLTDRSQYESVVNEKGTEIPGRCHHAFYKNSFGIEKVFNHRDMRTKENYEYLLRCIDRFTKLLASTDHKVFVLLSGDSGVDHEQFACLHNTLSKCTTNFYLIVFTLTKPRGDTREFGIDYIKSIGPSFLATMRPISKAGPFAFEDPFDDFMFRRAIVAFGVETKIPMTQEISLHPMSVA
jgi:hypothetical protein